MLRKLMVTTAVSALMIGAAAAQTSPPSGSQPSPQASPPAAQSQPAPQAQAAPKADVKFINSQSADQWLSSGFIGTDVIGADDAKIGDVTDILFDKEGKVVAYVVGVGGFLGIGAKNVALAPSAFQTVPARTGTTGTAGSAVRSDDVKLKLSMTKDQLQQAAAFESKRDQDAKMRAQQQPAPGGGMAPRPSGSPSAPKQ